MTTINLSDVYRARAAIRPHVHPTPVKSSPTLSALTGAEVSYLSGARTPLRYQRLMHRSASRTHESYLAYYRDTHSRYGVETPGIDDYVQFHVDLAASENLASRTGAGLWDVDSISELHVVSVEGFMEALRTSGAHATFRETRGKEIDAACGQLRIRSAKSGTTEQETITP